jgi:hypothetical protein
MRKSSKKGTKDLANIVLREREGREMERIK